MCCEETGAADVCCDVVEDGLCDCYTVVGTSAASELVEDDEGSRRGFGKDLLSFGELDEEGALGGEDVVVGSETRHDAINWSQCGGDAGDIASDLSHDDSDTGLTSISKDV